MLNPRLIITADDYGLNQSCNQGIRDAVEKGIVSSVHVMMNLVNDRDMELLIKSVQDGGNQCGIGLHLNTTWGRAMIQEEATFKHNYGFGLESPSGEDYTYRQLKHYHHGKVVKNPSELLKMKNDLFAQYTALKNYLGSANKIDAISSHQNIHFWDYQFVEILCEISRKGNIPFRSLRRWETEKKPDLETKKYPRGLSPLIKAGLRNLLNVIDAPTTQALVDAAVKKSKLKKLQQNLILQGSSSIPHNNTGHWFGQPSDFAMQWFIEALKDINSKTESGGYTSEIYMHLASSLDGDRDYDYKMPNRVAEYVTIMDKQFILDFNTWKHDANIEHGSYRKVLQGAQIIY